MADRKGTLSCAECRRSKLKCDRMIPCSTCVRRGCSELCPDKTLAATKGNKVLMDHAQRLEGEVKTMKSKIKQLEEALANARATNTRATGSLLDSKFPQDCPPNFFMHPNDDEPEVGEATTSTGSFSVGSDGQTNYYGSSAGSEFLSRLVLTEEDESQTPHSVSTKYSGLCPEIIELALASPYGIRDCKHPKSLFLPFIPSKAAAQHLADLYYQNAAWMYDPVIRDDFESIISGLYDEEGAPSLDTIHPHHLSVFFIILATGATFDDDASLMTERYNALAAAALSLESILKNVTLSALQSLFLMVRFSYITEPTIDETRWLLFGACARAAQVIGLQRDSAPWNLEAHEVQMRRLVFWEIYTWDSWGSFVHARPCMFRLEEIDCRYPEGHGFARPNGEVELSFHGWKYRYQVTCISQTMRCCMAHKTPNYSTFLEVDRRIRTFPLPTHLISPTDESGQGWSSDPGHAMQQYSVIVIRESNLLFLHRSFFAKAIKEAPRNPLGHRYSPSVLAAYRSARRLICSLRGVYVAHPKLTSVTWYFWSAIYSACYILGGIVVESPGCSLSQTALTELERTIPFFEQGSSKCRIPGTMLLLKKLLLRARTIYTSFQNGIETASEHLAEDPDLLDEVAIISGRATVVRKAKQSSNLSTPLRASASPRPRKASHYSDDSRLNNLTPDIGMDFFTHQQFMTRDAIPADFGPSAPVELNQMYSQFSQPVMMMDYAPSERPDTYHQQQAPPIGTPPSGSHPNEVWANFIQQLNMDRYSS